VCVIELVGVGDAELHAVVVCDPSVIITLRWLGMIAERTCDACES